MEERIDILSESGEKTGETCTLHDAHARGFLHHTAHVWVLNSDSKLLLQKRSGKMAAHPNLWSISASGHTSAGQTSREAARRETEEELGLSFPEESFKYLFTKIEHEVLNNGTYINNEFNDVYLVKLDTPTPEIKVDGKEVSDTKWVSIDEFKMLINNREPSLVPLYEEYKKLIGCLSENI